MKNIREEKTDNFPNIITHQGEKWYLKHVKKFAKAYFIRKKFRYTYVFGIGEGKDFKTVDDLRVELNKGVGTEYDRYKIKESIIGEYWADPEDDSRSREMYVDGSLSPVLRKVVDKEAEDLYKEGWRSKDIERLIAERRITEDNAETMCKLLIKYENKNHNTEE